MTYPPIDPAAAPPEPTDPTAPGSLGSRPPPPGPFQPGGPPYDTGYRPYRPGHASVPPAPSYPETGYPSASSDSPVTAIPAYWPDSGGSNHPPGPGTAGYPPGVPPQFTQPHRRSKMTLVAIVATVVTVLLCGAVGLGGFLLSDRSDNNSSTNPAAPRQATSPRATGTPAGSHHTVAYEVTGTGHAIITFGSSNGMSHDETALPWHREVTVRQNNFLVTVLAFALGGELSCRVLVDGKQVARETSDNVVTCTQLITG
jgi:hypothetical protein